MLIETAEDLIRDMNWETKQGGVQTQLEGLFPDLSEEEQEVMNILHASEDGMHANGIVSQTGKAYADVATTLMIGDNFQTDILGAQQAGLAVIYFNRFPEYPAPSAVDYEVTSLKQIMEIL